MPKVKYRCQKSYVVLMSDGDANLSCRRDNTGRIWSRPDFGYGYDRYSKYYNKNRYISNPFYKDSIPYNEAYNYFGARPHGFCQYEQGGRTIPLGIEMMA